MYHQPIKETDDETTLDPSTTLTCAFSSARAGLAFALLLFGISACGAVATPTPESETPEPMPITASFPDLGPAPELTNEVWLNVDAPLRLARAACAEKLWPWTCGRRLNPFPENVNSLVEGVAQ